MSTKTAPIAPFWSLPDVYAGQGEGAVPQVSVQQGGLVPTQTGDEQIGPAVAVHVAKGSAVGESHIGYPRHRRLIAEGDIGRQPAG